MDLDAQTRRLLAELAYLASMSNDVARARRIVDGLAAIDPDGAPTVIGYALADMTLRDFEAAIRRLRPLADAGDAHGMVFLGLALKLAGRTSECDAVLSRLPNDDAAVEALAGALR
ncbi:MAG: hypothetical protein WDN25_15210 [Acetobacteraceae bacterium]